jgi:hypothetical protein
MAHELYNQLSRYLDASYRATKNYQHEVDFILRRVGNRAGRKILVFVIFEKGRKKIVETQNKFFLPDRTRILEIMKQVGFTPKIYFDFSETKRNGAVCVFVGRKER